MCWHRYCRMVLCSSRRWEANFIKQVSLIGVMSTLITEQWNNLESSEKFYLRNWPLNSKRDKRCQQHLWSESNFIREFDPGSGWTLAACLTHASRTRYKDGSFRTEDLVLSGGRVSNAWETCPVPGDTSWKRLLIPHKRTAPHGAVWKTPVEQDGPASD